MNDRVPDKDSEELLGLSHSFKQIMSRIQENLKSMPLQVGLYQDVLAKSNPCSVVLVPTLPVSSSSSVTATPLQTTGETSPDDNMRKLRHDLYKLDFLSMAHNTICTDITGHQRVASTEKTMDSNDGQ